MKFLLGYILFGYVVVYLVAAWTGVGCFSLAVVPMLTIDILRRV